MSVSRPALLVLAVLLSACDQISALDGSKAREADGVAVGSACRQAGRAIEDCFTMNPDSPKASVFAGWKEMNDYMVQNKLDTVAPQLAKAEPKVVSKGEAKAEADDKHEIKATAAEEPKEAAKAGAREEPREAATEAAKDKDPSKEHARESAREIMREIKRENAFKEPAKAGAAPPTDAAPAQGATLVLPGTPSTATAEVGPKVAPPLPTVVKPIPQSH